MNKATFLDMQRSQKNLIESSNWNVLIILDACRYDFFSRIFSFFLDGNLRKVYSPASHTSTWRKKIFLNDDFSDATYISANPFINSKMEVNGFNSNEIFHEIIDVWDFGWDSSLGTVPPDEVTNALRSKIKDSGRIIAHYMQPHAPYLLFGKKKIGSLPDLEEKGKTRRKVATEIIQMFEDKVQIPQAIQRLLCNIGPTLGLNISPERSVYARFGPKVLRKAYSKNLELALESVAQVIHENEFQSREIIITSDHGELLGDGGFSHFFGSKKLKLREVPWLELSKGRDE